MAKKKKKSTSGKKPSLGTGKKLCPACGQIIAARSATCPHCEHKFVPKRKKKRARKSEPEAAAKPQAEVDVATVVAAHDLITRCGGIGDYRTAWRVPRQPTTAILSCHKALADSNEYYDLYGS